MTKTKSETPPAEEPAVEAPKALRVRLIDPDKTFGVPVMDKGRQVEELVFNREHMEHDIPVEAEGRVRANMDCPFPDVYDVNADIPDSVQFALAQLKKPQGRPTGKTATRGGK